jgi:hypothetical protein
VVACGTAHFNFSPLYHLRISPSHLIAVLAAVEVSLLKFLCFVTQLLAIAAKDGPLACCGAAMSES